MMDSVVVKLWRGSPECGSGTPGTVLSADGSGIVIACGESALRITELQKPGGKRLSAADFLRGTPVVPGQRFNVPA
jgi:methionyl-tRNA formyltransferase